jgi:membrane protein DedA with SNARE-associated domain
LTASLAAVFASGPPSLPGFLAALSSPLEHYGLWAILLLVFLEDFGIPVPGETVLIAAAVYAGSGRLNIVAVAVIGFVAAVLGDNIGYAIGRFGGQAVVLRWGKYIFLTPERLEKAQSFFNRHGGKIIVIARFVEGLRQANGIIAGISGMRWLRFLVFNMIGAALWVGTWVCVGYFAGQHITTIYDYITRYSLYALIVAVVLVAAWIIHRVYKHRASARRHEPAKTAGKAEAPEATAKVEATETTETTEVVGKVEAPEAPEAPEAIAKVEAAETPEAIAETETEAETIESTGKTETTEKTETTRTAGEPYRRGRS